MLPSKWQYPMDFEGQPFAGPLNYLLACRSVIRCTLHRHLRPTPESAAKALSHEWDEVQAHGKQSVKKTERGH